MVVELSGRRQEVGKAMKLRVGKWNYSRVPCMQLPLRRHVGTSPTWPNSAERTFIFICLPLYFRFNFSLFVATLANGGKGIPARRMGKGTHTKWMESPEPYLSLSSGLWAQSSGETAILLSMPIKLIILSASISFRYPPFSFVATHLAT